MSRLIVKVGYRRSQGPAVFMRDGLLQQNRRPETEIPVILHHVQALRDGPHAVAYEKLDDHIASNLYTLWVDGSYFLYRIHKPASGPFAGHEWVVHILDIDSFRPDADGNRILHLYEDPAAVRTLAERDGAIVTTEP